MKRNILLFVVYISVFCCMLVSIPEKEASENKVEKEAQLVSVSNASKESEQLELEEYIVGVVASEMPVGFELEALKAQAVAARSFVVSRNYKVDDTTRSQVYSTIDKLKANWGAQYETNMAKISLAVEETKGEVLYYNGKVVNALYFSTSNGQTVNSEDYYQSALPYLVAVDSAWDLEENPRAEVSTTFQAKDIQAKLGLDVAVNSITIVSRYDNHRVNEVKVNSTIYTGRELREALGLRSTDFTVQADKDTYTFTTIGFGHGVGMSQYGANAMAKLGYSYKEILLHYYTGVTLEKSRE